MARLGDLAAAARSSLAPPAHALRGRSTGIRPPAQNLRAKDDVAYSVRGNVAPTIAPLETMSLFRLSRPFCVVCTAAALAACLGDEVRTFSDPSVSGSVRSNPTAPAIGGGGGERGTLLGSGGSAGGDGGAGGADAARGSGGDAGGGALAAGGTGGEASEPEPTSIRALTSATQAATPGHAVAAPPLLRVLDGDGQGFAGVGVRLRIDAGTTIEGSGLVRVDATTFVAITDAQGAVDLDRWTMGKRVDEYRIEASLPDYGDVAPLTFVARASTNFDVQVEFVQSVSPAQAEAFDRAARRWEGIILNALPTITTNLRSLAEGCNSIDESLIPPTPVSTEGVVIFADLAPIDGPGQILGAAGPCLVRLADDSPLSGLMRFDTADFSTLEANGQLEDVILHEMGHVLGVGTLWGVEGFVRNPSVTNGAGADTHHIGAETGRAFDDLGGAGFSAGTKVPLENSAVVGSADSHWRESVARNELMTPSLNQGASPLSELTIASIDDFSFYRANYAVADTFDLGVAGDLTVSPSPGCAILHPSGAHAPAGAKPAP